MTDYERHLPPMRQTGFLNHPIGERTWELSTVLTAGCSIVSLASVLIGITWGYARVSNATDAIPLIQSEARSQHALAETNRQDISNLKIQQTYNDAHYAEILIQLSKIDGKVDKLNDSKADKQMKGWTR